MSGFIIVLLKIALVVIALFMILLILVQRGRGGGLAGALGGPGGSSAFGAKAGDAFTRITAYTALVWMAVCIFASVYFSAGASDSGFATVDDKRAVRTEPAGDGAGSGALGSAEAEPEGNQNAAGDQTPPAEPAPPTTSDETAPAEDESP